MANPLDDAKGAERFARASMHWMRHSHREV